MKKFTILFCIICSLLVVTSCNKDYSLEGGTFMSTGTWSFGDETTTYAGNIDTAFITVNSGTKVMHLQGPSTPVGQIFNLTLYTSDYFQPGTYKVSASEVDLSLASISKTFYQTDIIAGDLSVTITSISGNTVTGTFSGVADDSTGATKNIVLGQFTSTIDLTNNVSNNSSVGTLGATAGQCTPALVSGTYTQNSPVNSSNTVQVQVNITTPGTYTITTSTANGISFSGAGSFSANGVQTVALTAAGTPSSSGTKTFTVTYGASTCTFDVIFN